MCVKGKRMKSWRQKVDPSIKEHLEVQIAESAKHVNAYKEAPNPRNAQLWCAVANLSKQVAENSMRLKYLENAVKQALPKAKIETEEDLMKRMIGVEKLIGKATEKGKNLKRTLKKY